MFQCKKDAYNTESLIEFLQELHRHFPDDKLTLIWDGLPSHRSKDMKAWLATQRRWLFGRAAPGLRPRPQPRGAGMGQRKGRGTGQPVPRHH